MLLLIVVPFSASYYNNARTDLLVHLFQRYDGASYNLVQTHKNFESLESDIPEALVRLEHGERQIHLVEYRGVRDDLHRRIEHVQSQLRGVDFQCAVLVT